MLHISVLFSAVRSIAVLILKCNIHLRGSHACIIYSSAAIFLQTTSSYTRQFDRPKCLQVVSVWCPASATCSSGVHLDGCS